MSFFTDDYMQFFKELAANNNKDWFDDNRKRYETSVKKPFNAFVQVMIDRVQAEDDRVTMAPKDGIFRINRDIRFSKDKTPYKTSNSAIVSPGGKKDKTKPGMYFEFGPEHLRYYGGAHMLDKDQVQSVREAIAKDLKGFDKLINDKNFAKYFNGVLGEQQKRMPAELKAAAEEQPLILNKGWYFYSQFDADNITAPNLPDLLMDRYHAAQPLSRFLDQAMGNS